jgi:ankyrin repeat protein
LDFLLTLDDIDIDAQDNEGWTPFMAAVCWNQKEAMEKLASKGADMDMKNLRGETAYGRFAICIAILYM